MKDNLIVPMEGSGELFLSIFFLVSALLMRKSIMSIYQPWWDGIQREGCKTVPGKIYEFTVDKISSKSIESLYVKSK